VRSDVENPIGCVAATKRSNEMLREEVCGEKRIPRYGRILFFCKKAKRV
jgi:hypothetical protein